MFPMTKHWHFNFRIDSIPTQKVKPQCRDISEYNSSETQLFDLRLVDGAGDSTSSMDKICLENYKTSSELMAIIGNRSYLSVDWRTNEKLSPFCLVESKSLVR